MKNDIKKFVECCINQGEAEQLGDYRTNNKCYKELEKIYKCLKNEGRLTELIELHSHINPYVRLSAAIYTLIIVPEQSEKVLEDLISIKKCAVGFTAQVTLQEWRKGNLKF